MEQDLTTKMYDALNGNYPDRDKTEITTYEEIVFSENNTPKKITNFNTHFPSKNSNREGEKFGRRELESTILIPEEEGLIQVERVHNPGISYGFYTPEYPEKCLQDLFDAFSQKFADSGEIYKLSWITHPLSVLFPDEMKRFAKYEDRIIRGIANAHYEKEDDSKRNETALNNLVIVTEKMGVNQKDQKFISVFWEKMKQLPSGKIGTKPWSVVATYLSENNIQTILEFDRLRKGIARNSLAELLCKVPLNQDSEEEDLNQIFLTIDRTMNLIKT